MLRLETASGPDLVIFRLLHKCSQSLRPATQSPFDWMGFHERSPGRTPLSSRHAMEKAFAPEKRVLEHECAAWAERGGFSQGCADTSRTRTWMRAASLPAWPIDPSRTSLGHRQVTTLSTVLVLRAQAWGLWQWPYAFDFPASRATEAEARSPCLGYSPIWHKNSFGGGIGLAAES